MPPVKKKPPIKKKPAKSAPAKKVPVKKTSKKVVTGKAGVLDNPFPTLGEFSEPGKFIVLYGPPGEGKSTVSAFFPDPLFIFTSDEQGIKQALAAEVVPPEVKNHLVELNPLYGSESIPKKVGHPGWKKCIETLEIFEAGDHDRKTAVIDTASGLQNLCFQHCASMLFEGNMVDEQGFMNYYAGYIKAAEQFWQRELMVTCQNIVAKGYNVVLLAHSTIKNEPNPSGPQYQIFTVDLDRRIWDYTKKAAQGILFLGTHRSFSVEKATKKTKVTARDRFIGVTNQTWYDAKNWYNLQDEIDVGSSAKETYNNLASALGI